MAATANSIAGSLSGMNNSNQPQQGGLRQPKMKYALEELREIVPQWNANRLDMFSLSMPNDDGEFHGVMRFYFQDAGQKVATKCIRVSSTATAQDVIGILIEKFRPDIRMLSFAEYAIFEIHENGEERKLIEDERPLITQLDWHHDDREGRFLLRRMDEKSNMPQFDEANSNLKRKLSKREKKKLAKQQSGSLNEKKLKKKGATVDRANESLNGDSNDGGTPSKSSVAEKLYNELPVTSFTRSISNPEAVMKRRRQQKLEKRLQQFGQDPDAGGTLRIFGEALNKAVPYKTILLSARDTAAHAVKEMLEKYGKEKEDPTQFCLVQVITPHNNDGTGSVNAGSGLDGPGIGGTREYILDDDECPLQIERSHDRRRGELTFHIMPKPPDFALRKRKKKPKPPYGMMNGGVPLGYPMPGMVNGMTPVMNQMSNDHPSPASHPSIEAPHLSTQPQQGEMEHNLAAQNLQPGQQSRVMGHMPPGHGPMGPPSGPPLVPPQTMPRTSIASVNSEMHPDRPKIVTIQLHKGKNGMGLSIVAAHPLSLPGPLGIYIKSVVPGGAADADGRLEAGDQILSVNGQPLLGVSQARAAEIMTQTGPVAVLEVAKHAVFHHGLAQIIQQSPQVPKSQSMGPGQLFLNQNHIGPQPPMNRPQNGPIMGGPMSGQMTYPPGHHPHQQGPYPMPNGPFASSASMGPPPTPVSSVAIPSEDANADPQQPKNCPVHGQNSSNQGPGSQSSSINSLPRSYQQQHTRLPTSEPDSISQQSPAAHPPNGPMGVADPQVERVTRDLSRVSFQGAQEERHYQNIGMYQLQNQRFSQASNQPQADAASIKESLPTSSHHLRSTSCQDMSSNGPPQHMLTEQQQAILRNSAATLRGPILYQNGPQNRISYNGPSGQHGQMVPPMASQRTSYINPSNGQPPPHVARPLSALLDHRSTIGRPGSGFGQASHQQKIEMPPPQVSYRYGAAGYPGVPANREPQLAPGASGSSSTADPSITQSESNLPDLTRHSGPRPLPQHRFTHTSTSLGPSAGPPVAPRAAAEFGARKSSSPWEREEKEMMLRQREESARRWRDLEISQLESVPETHRTPKQEERLKTLILEREFEKRAQEGALHAEDEEDIDHDAQFDQILDRAANREMVLKILEDMEKQRQRRLEWESTVLAQQHQHKYPPSHQQGSSREDLLKQLREEEIKIEQELIKAHQKEENILKEARRRFIERSTQAKHEVVFTRTNEALPDTDTPPPLPKSPPPHDTPTPTNGSEAMYSHDPSHVGQGAGPNGPGQRLDRLLTSNEHHTQNEQHSSDRSMVGPPVVNRKTVSFSSVLRGSNGPTAPTGPSSAMHQEPPPIRQPKKSVSFNDTPNVQPSWTNRVAPHAKIDEINDEEEEDEEEASDDQEEPHYQNSHAHQSQGQEGKSQGEEEEGGYTLEDIDQVLSSKEPLREIWDTSAGNTPGVIGTQEVYKDPRQRMLEEKMKREREHQMLGEGQDAPTLHQMPERLPFKEKMKMFANEAEQRNAALRNDQNKRPPNRIMTNSSRSGENASGDDGQQEVASGSNTYGSEAAVSS